MLHEAAGRLLGIPTRYERLIPAEHELSADRLFDHARAAGFRGLNLTHPYKETLVGRVSIPDPRIAAIGAINTVLFEADGPKGHNTDFSGFVASWRARFGDVVPGPVCIFGAGGAGRAVAHALIDLGARHIALVDRLRLRADSLAASLKAAAPKADIIATDDPAIGISGARGILNCTPVGMTGHPGSPMPAKGLRDADWVFDAVYTPRDTRFLSDARAAGCATLPGFELFFWQGVHAIEIFHGQPVEPTTLRQLIDAVAT